MKNIEVNVKETLAAVTGEQIQALAPEAANAMKMLADGSGLGSDFLGWVNLPSEITDAHLSDIEAAAKNLRDNCD